MVLSAPDHQLIIEAAAEFQSRKTDALELYRLTPKQVEVLTDSHTAREYLLKGGNRSGKSHTAAMRFASIVRNKPLIAMDGTQIECIQDHQRGRKLLTWLVGLQLDHIGQTMYRLLFKAGLFDIIRDPKTGIWRAWHPPLHPEDFSIPRHKRKQSPPLIPPSEIEEWSWEKKAENQFSMCRLKNGNEIYAFASSAPVKAGDPVDEIWVDEEIKFDKHYAEWQARLVDREGRLFWSSWPAHANTALIKLNKRCDQQQKEVETGEREYATARKATLKMSENPFFTKKQVQDTLEGWSEEERRARDAGEFTTDLIRFYGEYNEEIHRCDYDYPEMDDPLAKALRDNNWVPPADWTRDLILDPGTAHPAILLCAIPPPEFWQDGESYIVPYREIYGGRWDATDIGKKVLLTERGYHLERFYIDGHAGRITPTGFGVTVESNYTEKWNELKLHSVQMPGGGFMHGSDDVPGRAMVVRSLMAIRPCGYPRLRIINRRCPSLVDQLRDTMRQVRKDEKLEVPAPGQTIDVMVCLEYYASRYPDFKHPKPVQRQKSPGELALEEERALELLRNGASTEPTYFGAA